MGTLMPAGVPQGGPRAFPDPCFLDFCLRFKVSSQEGCLSSDFPSKKTPASHCSSLCRPSCRGDSQRIPSSGEEVSLSPGSSCGVRGGLVQVSGQGS